MKAVLTFALLLPLSAAAQAPTLSGYAAPPPEAPASACSLTDLPASTPVRILSGPDPIPYAFACAQPRRAGACVGGTLHPGLVVNAGPRLRLLDLRLRRRFHLGLDPYLAA